MWRVYHLVILFYFAGLPARAQYDIPENNVWIFDKNAGLDFNSQKLGREIQWPNTITGGYVYDIKVIFDNGVEEYHQGNVTLLH